MVVGLPAATVTPWARISAKNRVAENFRSHGFTHKIGRAQPHCFDCKLDGSECCHHDHLRFRRQDLNTPENIRPDHTRHLLVQKDDVPRGGASQDRENFHSAPRFADYVSCRFQCQADHLADILFVINYQYSLTHVSSLIAKFLSRQPAG